MDEHLLVVPNITDPSMVLQPMEQAVTADPVDTPQTESFFQKHRIIIMGVGLLIVILLVLLWIFYKPESKKKPVINRDSDEIESEQEPEQEKEPPIKRKPVPKPAPKPADEDEDLHELMKAGLEEEQKLKKVTIKEPKRQVKANPEPAAATPKHKKKDPKTQRTTIEELEDVDVKDAVDNSKLKRKPTETSALDDDDITLEFD